MLCIVYLDYDGNFVDGPGRGITGDIDLMYRFANAYSGTYPFSFILDALYIVVTSPWHSLIPFHGKDINEIRLLFEFLNDEGDSHDPQSFMCAINRRLKEASQT